MIFHPYYESSFRFTRLGDDVAAREAARENPFRAHSGHAVARALSDVRPRSGRWNCAAPRGSMPATGEIHRIDAAIALGSE